MIRFNLNGKSVEYNGDRNRSLLEYLRNDLHLTAAKDGCSGQGVCGACSVEVNGSIKMACRIKMSDLSEAIIYTLEGLPNNFREILAHHFATKGAVQCGFCSPGMIMRARGLWLSNPKATRSDIMQ